MLINRHIERNKDQIKMYSTYNHLPILKQNYEERMSGDKGYIDQEKDFMRVGRIPIEFWASLSDEQKMELETNPQAVLKLLENNPGFITTSAKF